MARGATINLMNCPVCGKLFVPAPMHVYKVGGLKRGNLVCSWGCVRASEKAKEAKKKGSKANDAT